MGTSSREGWSEVAPQRRAVTAALLALLLPTSARADTTVVNGTSAADVINPGGTDVAYTLNGFGGNDRLTGSNLGDVLNGGYGADILDGGPGDDLLIGGPGNDTLVGGLDIDTARFSKARTNYTITGTAAQFTVASVANGDGTDKLSGIEFVEFTDGTVSVESLFAPPANRNPVAGADSVVIEPDTPVTIAVLANDSDPDGDTLRVDTYEQPQNGTTTSETASTIVYTPAEGFTGSDSFAYTVVDDRGGAATATVSIGVRDPPPVSDDALLDRIAAALEGTWLRVNANRLEQVWTPHSQRARAKAQGFDDPRRIISAWSSMAWDSNRRQLIIWGGGHGDYAGNDVYRFDAATLSWQRSSLPSAV